MSSHSATRKAWALVLAGMVLIAGPAAAIEYHLRAVVGIDDFNNNDKNDLLLHSGETGELEIWYMNELRRLGIGTPDSL